MIIDSLIDTELWVEQKVDTTITVNSKQNNKGRIEIDDLGNNLIDMIDAGNTKYELLRSYNGADGVMFYNTTTKELQVCNVGDQIHVRNDYVDGTMYFLGAKIEVSTKVNEKIFEVGIHGKKIFKVELMGQNISSYSVSGNTIKILGNDALLVDKFSEITVYLYEYNSIDQAITKVFGTRDESSSNVGVTYSEQIGFEFVIEYQTYKDVWSEDMMSKKDYWENFVGFKVENFNDAQISSSVEEDQWKAKFSSVKKRILNSVDNSIRMTTFEGKEFFNISDLMIGKGFRLIFYNGYYKRVVFVNDCEISNDISIVYSKDKNTKTFSIHCGNYIDINTGEERAYGKGVYGKGIYGGNMTVRNSSRLGG